MRNFDNESFQRSFILMQFYREGNKEEVAEGEINLFKRRILKKGIKKKLRYSTIMLK